MNSTDYFVLLAYFAVMVAIGLWAMFSVKNQEDYFLGGRGFGKLLQTFAAFGAGTGANEPVMVGSTAWTSGLSGVWSALMWLFVTPVYWITAVWYRRMRHLTLGDWFVERYQSKSLGAAYALFAVVFYMFYLSTMLAAIAASAAPLLGVDEHLFGFELKDVLVPTLALIVVLYGVLGGLKAAYWTDLVQGVFIIILSVLLIPFGLWALVTQFGDPTTQGVVDGFTILHQRVAADYFNVFSGPAAGDFPPQYIASLTILALVGIVVQPHFIATGGGSAKSETEARIGLVVGNFLKRLCTVGWALTALIALALLAGNPEIAADPDRVWGVAAREILGPLNLGLVGLMLACLMAALMSSADCYMIVTSALITRNVYQAYLNPYASEKNSVLVARITGLAIIVGASFIAMRMSSVFGQFKLAVELTILFAAPFWVGLYWRRANKTSAWITILFSALAFFILPFVIPMLAPGLRTNTQLSATTDIITKTISRKATAADVARHEAWVLATDHAKQVNDAALLEKIGPEPPLANVDDEIKIVLRSGGKPIFWQQLEGETELKIVKEFDESNTHIVVSRHVKPQLGVGPLNLDFLLYYWLGYDLSGANKGMLETLRIPPRVLLPFLVLILASLITPRGDNRLLDRYYAKMRLEVDPDPEIDEYELNRAYRHTSLHESKQIFPGTSLEFNRPRVSDIVGFVICVGVCFLIIGLLVWLAGIGAPA